MDNCWDGFYTCQKRASRFPTLIYQGWDHYNIEFTGTNPMNMEFILYGRAGTPGILLTILYPMA
jgi:hypothetical protein